MFVSFDYRCPSCFSVASRFIRKSEMDKQKCDECDTHLPMNRLPAGTRTTFRYADTKLKG